MSKYCPQCGEDADEFQEGVCVDCRHENQERLDQHNWAYDRWSRMTDNERWDEIRHPY